jgi:arsenate reductase (glutaredoxin)
MQEIGVDQTWEIIDIKQTPIKENVIDAIKNQSGSYEAFFSKRAIKYQELKKEGKILTDTDYKNLMLSEYTFLQRPICLIDDIYYVGNNKSTIISIQEALKK